MGEIQPPVLKDVVVPEVPSCVHDWGAAESDPVSDDASDESPVWIHRLTIPDNYGLIIGKNGRHIERWKEKHRLSDLIVQETTGTMYFTSTKRDDPRLALLIEDLKEHLQKREENIRRRCYTPTLYPSNTFEVTLKEFNTLSTFDIADDTAYVTRPVITTETVAQKKRRKKNKSDKNLPMSAMQMRGTIKIGHEDFIDEHLQVLTDTIASHSTEALKIDLAVVLGKQLYVGAPGKGGEKIPFRKLPSRVLHGIRSRTGKGSGQAPLKLKFHPSIGVENFEVIKYTLKELGFRDDVHVYDTEQEYQYPVVEYLSNDKTQYIVGKGTRTDSLFMARKQGIEKSNPFFMTLISKYDDQPDLRLSLVVSKPMTDLDTKVRPMEPFAMPVPGKESLEPSQRSPALSINSSSAKASSLIATPTSDESSLSVLGSEVALSDITAEARPNPRRDRARVKGRTVRRTRVRMIRFFNEETLLYGDLVRLRVHKDGNKGPVESLELKLYHSDWADNRFGLDPNLDPKVMLDQVRMVLDISNIVSDNIRWN